MVDILFDVGSYVLFTLFVKGSAREKWKGVYADHELNSGLITSEVYSLNIFFLYNVFWDGI